MLYDKKDVCQKILLDYWEELITSKNLFLFDVESSPHKTFEKVFKNKPKINSVDAIYFVGLWALSKQGIRDTRAIIERHNTSRTWYRIAEDLPFLDEISGKTYHGWVKQIRDNLASFTPLIFFPKATTKGLPCNEM